MAVPEGNVQRTTDMTLSSGCVKRLSPFKSVDRVSASTLMPPLAQIIVQKVGRDIPHHPTGANGREHPFSGGQAAQQPKQNTSSRGERRPDVNRRTHLCRRDHLSIVSPLARRTGSCRPAGVQTR